MKLSAQVEVPGGQLFCWERTGQRPGQAGWLRLPAQVACFRRTNHCDEIYMRGQCKVFPQVEVWLNRVLDRMCATLRHLIPEAVVTYEEKPREQWIFDYPAQVWNRWGPTAVWLQALGHHVVC